LIFGSTYITATATNKEGTEIRNCEFKFETASGSSLPASTSSPKKKGNGFDEEEEK
jgi:hypothetical protein